MVKKRRSKNFEKGIFWVISEASFFAFLYYAQNLLQVSGNIWISSFFLWLLMNLAIVFCPVVRKCYK